MAFFVPVARLLVAIVVSISFTSRAGNAGAGRGRMTYRVRLFQSPRFGTAVETGRTEIGYRLRPHCCAEGLKGHDGGKVFGPPHLSFLPLAGFRRGGFHKLDSLDSAK